nr:stage III sporulation protein AG [uncultured Butyricicoccus sp.]
MELDRVKTAVQAGLNGLVPKIGKYKYALIVLLVGILLLYAGGGARDRPEQEQSVPDGTEQAAFDLAAFEDELESKLAQIAGVGRVELMLSLEQTGEAVYASNVRQSASGEQNGSYESTLSTVSDGSYGEQPVRLKQTCPTFRGAVVLCDGAGSHAVQLAVTQAVSAVCGLGADRISVIQMGQ